MADPRSELVRQAARLLDEGGAAAVTTRAVAAAAGVQVPVIYRLFGDRAGLLDAAAAHTLAHQPPAADSPDPLEALRRGFEAEVAFGVANPAVFALLTDPARAASPAVVTRDEALRARVHLVAAAGLLRVAEGRAADLLRAAANGAVQTLLATPRAARDPGLAEALCDAVLVAILGDPPAAPWDDQARAAAIALRAVSGDLMSLTGSERRLLGEWLDREIG